MAALLFMFELKHCLSGDGAGGGGGGLCVCVCVGVLIAASIICLGWIYDKINELIGSQR